MQRWWRWIVCATIEPDLGSLCLLWSQRVCINSWLHREQRVPLTFSWAALHSLNVFDTWHNAVIGLITVKGFHEHISQLYNLELWLIYLSLCSHHFPPSVSHIFILFIWKLQLVYVPAVEPEDFHIYVRKHMKSIEQPNTRYSLF